MITIDDNTEKSYSGKRDRFVFKISAAIDLNIKFYLVRI